jgi:membrane-bound serine protease (ClpP class)
VTGIVGGIALVLAFIGFSNLPLNVIGLLLIGLSVVLFVLEISVTSHGLLTIAGLIFFVLGASTLYSAPTTPGSPPVTVAMPLVLLMAALVVGWVALVLAVVVSARRRTRAFGWIFGAGGTRVVPAGSEAVAKSRVSPVGVVYALGEEWTARNEAGTDIEPGQHVRVIGQDGLTLLVEAGPTDGAGEAETTH